MVVRNEVVPAYISIILGHVENDLDFVLSQVELILSGVQSEVFNELFRYCKNLFIMKVGIGVKTLRYLSQEVRLNTREALTSSL